MNCKPGLKPTSNRVFGRSSCMIGSTAKGFAPLPKSKPSRRLGAVNWPTILLVARRLVSVRSPVTAPSNCCCNWAMVKLSKRSGSRASGGSRFASPPKSAVQWPAISVPQAKVASSVTSPSMKFLTKCSPSKAKWPSGFLTLSLWVWANRYITCRL